MALVLTAWSSLTGTRSVGADVNVRPARAAFDTPSHISADDLRPGERAVLYVSSTDARGVRWSSSATYIADRTGQVDLGRSAPVAGSYSGVNPMGLFEAMTPAGSHPGGLVYWWSGALGRPFTVTVRV